MDWRGLNDRWLVLQVRTGWECKSASCIRERGYEVFVPTYSRRLKWSGRVTNVPAPLFPGYLFVRFRDLNRQPIVSAPGAMRFLCTGRRPVPIEEDEIRSLQIINDARASCGPCPFLQVGQDVEIREGALRGLRGRIVRTKTKHRVIISVVLLQKSVFVELDDYDVLGVGASVGGIGIDLKAVTAQPDDLNHTIASDIRNGASRAMLRLAS